jgi:hypothetical protein
MRQGREKYSSYSFLTSKLYGGEWSATCSGRVLLPERTPGTHWTRGWVGLRAGLDTEARGEIRCFCRGSNPIRPVCSQTLYWLSYSSSIFLSDWTYIRLIGFVWFWEKQRMRSYIMCINCGNLIEALWNVSRRRICRWQPSGIVQGVDPDDGGSTHLWNVGILQRQIHGAISQKALIFGDALFFLGSGTLTFKYYLTVSCYKRYCQSIYLGLTSYTNSPIRS